MMEQSQMHRQKNGSDIGACKVGNYVSGTNNAQGLDNSTSASFG
jgi:hypothetical protein